MGFKDLGFSCQAASKASTAAWLAGQADATIHDDIGRNHVLDTLVWLVANRAGSCCEPSTQPARQPASSHPAASSQQATSIKQQAANQTSPRAYNNNVWGSKRYGAGLRNMVGAPKNRLGGLKRICWGAETIWVGLYT